MNKKPKKWKQSFKSYYSEELSAKLRKNKDIKPKVTKKIYEKA